MSFDELSERVGCCCPVPPACMTIFVLESWGSELVITVNSVKTTDLQHRQKIECDQIK
jgi:hypothetical protein